MDIYYSIFRITGSGIEPIIIAKTDSTNNSIHRFSTNKSPHKFYGVEFKIVYADDKSVQIIEYTYNTFTTMILGASVDNSGIRRDIKYDTPILIETDGGFAGVLCSYIFLFSRQQISLENIYKSIGVNPLLHITPETYEELQKRLSVFNSVF